MARHFHLIVFDVPIDNSTVVVHLAADFALHESFLYYVIDNLRTVNQEKGGLLPMLKIARGQDRWVHFDSGKETYLSEIVGKAIDDFESGMKRSSSPYPGTSSTCQTLCK
ncbi:MAG TPA: hypothetical protein VIH61_00340 [Waddliaceae bacterium]